LNPVAEPTADDVLVIGAGPAGLMAAQVLAGGGARVRVFDAMASVGRKFLLAGRGGLNLTHSEPPALFASRYFDQSPAVQPWLQEFGPAEVVAWAQGLGVETFVGSSGRVFPRDMKAAPLLRAWLQLLRRGGVQFSMRHRWLGWDHQGQLLFETPAGLQHCPPPPALVLALGGGSWARLGSDGRWVDRLVEQGVSVEPLRPSNCGFDVAGATGQGWSDFFWQRHAGQPLKSVALSFVDSQGKRFARKGEFVATRSGVEGSLIYAVSALLREEIARSGSATPLLDLLPDRTLEEVSAEVARPRGSRSMASHLKSRLRLDGIKSSLLHELLDRSAWHDPQQLARAIKALPLRLLATRPIDEAISSAGGVRLGEGVDAQLRLRAHTLDASAVFCAGEMLDWEAPTGGYLLTACLASGHWAGRNALSQWRRRSTMEG
jgi:uncharacterized flavoprotein (TIGR03862 family)